MHYVILLLCLIIFPTLIGMMFLKDEKGFIFAFAHSYVMGLIFELALFSLISRFIEDIAIEFIVFCKAYWGFLGLLSLFSFVKNRKSLICPLRRNWIYTTRRIFAWFMCLLLLVGYQVAMCRNSVWYLENEQLITAVNDLNNTTFGIALWYRSLITITGMRMYRLMELVLPFVWLIAHYLLMFYIGKGLFGDSNEKGLAFSCAVALWNMFGAGYQWLPCPYLLYEPATGEGILTAILIPAFFVLFLKKVKKRNLGETLVGIIGLGLAMSLVSQRGIFIWMSLLFLYVGILVYDKVRRYVGKYSVFN